MNTNATKKLMALLLALAMLLAACGSGGNSDDEATEDTTSDNGLFEETAEDAEGEFVPSPATETEAMEEEAVEETSDRGSSGEEAAIAPDQARDGQSDGFFGQDEDDESDRSEDNTFEDYGVRPFVDTARDPFSTFALDVDTASYSIAQQWLSEGQLPPAESVRVEEFINSFDYDYRAPGNGLNVTADAGPSPFDKDNVIVRLGVQAEEVRNSERPDASLTFVVDTSGSMDRDNRIGLVKIALERLVNELDRDDTVAIVTYSDGAEVLLEPTSIRDRDEILDAIDDLRTNGSTNLEAGLIRGYELASDSFIRNGINRVILASDGVANVGLTDPDGLVRLIRDDADRGIQLVTVGVGMGNYNDVTMETLADDGDGFYAYVNEVDEAERLFSDDLVSTLLTVAIDAKIQVEFDEDAVESYRLLGYENRAVLDRDFRNDDVDAGELGAGHQVTALYELKLRSGISTADRLGTVSMRWEDPSDGDVIETRLELAASILEDRWSDTDSDFRLAVTVAALAEVLRDSPFAGDIDLEDIAEEVDNLGNSSSLAELADLVDSARRLR
jgi:Ca-activated chloride channel family protein